MVESQIEIINKLGLHARAAAKFVNLATEFESDVNLSFNGREVNGKSIMGVMMLAAAKGSVIDISVSGPDEQQALDALQKLAHNYFDEGE